MELYGYPFVQGGIDLAARTSRGRFPARFVVRTSSIATMNTTRTLRTPARFAALLACAALPASLGAPLGAQGLQIQLEQKVSATAGGFTGTLDIFDFFGASITPVGDLNGDGVPDLAVGAPRDDDGGTTGLSGLGAVWVLFLNANGTVASHQKISMTEGGFTGPLVALDDFGSAVAQIGDLDGDGVTDLAVGAAGDDSGGMDRGAVYVLFLNTDGTVKAEQKISSTVGGFGGTLGNGDRFGGAIVGLGDLDGNGAEDIAVGARSSDNGGADRGAVHILFLNTNGTVASSVELASGVGGMAALDNSDAFGSSLAILDDLDGSGVIELVVGAIGDDDGGADRGAAWILFLDATGNATSTAKISSTVGGFTGPLANADRFGSSAANMGDLDFDGIPDLAVGAEEDDDGGLNRGAVWVLFMNTNGTVKDKTLFSSTTGGLAGPLDNDDFFGSAVAALGDLNGDGLTDLSVGARLDDDGTLGAGAIYNLVLVPSVDAFVTFRNGGNSNPAGYAQVNEPLLGQSWLSTIDIATPGAAASLIALSTGGATSGVMLSGFVNGELLTLPPFLSFNVSVDGNHAVPIPSDLNLLGVTIFTQGGTLTVGPTSVQLQNALDLTLGTF